MVFNRCYVFCMLLLLIGSVFVNCLKTSGTATLEFTIIDAESNQPIPGKLIFIKGNEDNFDLNIPETFGLAPEGNGFYTAFGKGEVEIPAGTYTIYASRGMEYSVDKKKIRFKKDAVVEQQWLIQRELDPQGYVASALHMHTTNSDGHCSEEERVTSLIGEGIEFAVATDHNFVTDLEPAKTKLNVGHHLTTCPGNELTTRIGHFNIFPLPANTAPFDARPRDPNILFKYRDTLPAPVVNQVNHPRSKGSDYFTFLDIEPATSVSASPLFSDNFEAMEIMNRPIGWGVVTGIKSRVSVWDEWFNFLNSGFRVTGTGNSDSHYLISVPVGTPRNYIASSTDDPIDIDAYSIAQNIIDHKVSVARGVFVNLTLNGGYQIGSEAIDTDGSIDLLLEVFAPSWVKVDKVVLYGNAREVWSEKLNHDAGTLIYKKEIRLNPMVDTWYVLKAEGSQSMWPIVPDDKESPVTPFGFTNPIWIDSDGNGFETERDRARRILIECSDDISGFEAVLKTSDWWLRRQLLALLEKGSEKELLMIRQLLSSGVKDARRFAYARIGENANSDDIQLLNAVKKNLKDRDERLIIDTYIATLRPKSELLDFLFNSVINTEQNLRNEQCGILSMKQYLKQWSVIGPFASEDDHGLDTRYAPEDDVDYDTSCFGKNEHKIHWQRALAEPNGFIDLTKITEDKNNSIAYAHANIHSSEKFESVLFFGSDDGAAIWHNGQEIYRESIHRSANPFEEIIPLTLSQGDNSFLIKVDNGKGGWGFYFEIFNPLDNLSEN